MIAQGYLQIFGVVVNIAIIFQKLTFNIFDVNQYMYHSINKRKKIENSSSRHAYHIRNVISFVLSYIVYFQFNTCNGNNILYLEL